MSYVNYTVSYRDLENNPRDINGLTYKEAQFHAKNLIKSGVIWLEVFKVSHKYEMVYEYSNYKNKPDNITEIIRKKEDLNNSKLPNEIKEQLKILFNEK